MPISLRIGPSGKTLLAVCTNDAGALVNVSAVGAYPTLTVGGSPVAVANHLWRSTLPYVVYNLESAVSPGATVTATSAAGWLTTAAGAAAALVGASVLNDGSPILPAFVSSPKSMRTGYNFDADTYYSNVITHANNFFASGGWSKSTSSPTWTYSPTGELASSTGEVWILVNQGSTSNGVDAKGYPTAPPGTWTLKWDGSHSGVSLSLPSGDPATLTATGSTITGGANNTRTYDLALNPSVRNYATIRVVVTGNQTGGVSNIRVYPPGQATDGSQLWHSGFLTKLANTKSVRFMDAAGCNASNVVEYSDWVPANQVRASLNPEQAARTFTISEVGPYANSPAVLESSAGWKWYAMTTSAPHGMVTGNTITITAPSAAVAFTGGGAASINNLNNAVYVTGPTTFAIAGYSTTAGTPTPGQAITATATLRQSRQIPIAHMIDLCNRLGADMHLSLPHLISNAAVDAIADEVAAGLNAGLKLVLEYSNEPWNMATGFTQYHYFTMRGAEQGIHRLNAYVKRACEVHARAKARFTAAGRGNGLVRTLGSQAANPSVTSRYVDYLEANSLTVDRIDVAPYLNLGPGGNDAAWDSMSVEQVADAADANVLYGGYFTKVITNHRTIAKAKFPSLEIGCYEGGPERAAGGGTVAIRNASNRAWHRHPRARALMLWYLQSLQDQGCTVFNQYTLARGVTDNLWGVYQSTIMEAGKGDGSDGKFDNRTDPTDQTRVVSPIGWAIDTWTALVDAEAPDPDPDPDPDPEPEPEPRIRRLVIIAVEYA